ncbi:MAG: hypothetical protein IT249_07285 [Chitinophagaceae bacterium]|nr:hypothetical protein [Chitinophagaceae bacterium]
MPVLIMCIMSAHCGEAQNRFIDSFNVWNTPAQIKSFQSVAIGGDVYYFQPVRDRLGAWLSMYKATGHIMYFNVLKNFIDTLIAQAATSNTIQGNRYEYKDNFKGWIYKTNDGELFGMEVPLSEGYIMRYLFEFIYLAKKYGVVENNAEWCRKTLTWLTENEWTKWRSRSIRQFGKPNTLFLRVRLHMGAHWAAVALLLNKMTSVDSIREQTKSVVEQYDLLAKRGFIKNDFDGGAAMFSQTYGNTKNTDAQESAVSVIQDVSHANHFISYIVLANQLGCESWNDAKITEMANLDKNILYKGDYTFWDLINGTEDPKRAGNWGNYQADGWLLLDQYDTGLFKIHTAILDNANDITKRYGQLFNYRANLALAYATIHKSPYVLKLQ